MQVISAGDGCVQSGDLKTAAVDQCVSAEVYQVNEKNHYERYLEKSENGSTVKSGDTLQSSDGKHLTVKNSKGETILTRQITGDFPKLKPGVNTLCLNFKRKTNEKFRVSAEVIKKYS